MPVPILIPPFAEIYKNLTLESPYPFTTQAAPPRMRAVQLPLKVSPGKNPEGGGTVDQLEI